MKDTWEDFEGDVTSHSGRTRGFCTVRTILDSLNPSARARLQATLDNPQLSSAAISKALKKRLGDAAPQHHTVNRHRRGDCSCP